MTFRSRDGVLLSSALPSMQTERHDDAVVVWAPAKVNLFLEVFAKRAEGYHEIATLLVAVSLSDRLEFKEDATGNITLTCDQADLDCGPGNLICRAARLLQERSGCSPGAAIALEKRIPVAAGLGGGSSDAAATLAGLNQLWELGLSRRELLALSGEIGSDVAFFLTTPAAWCTGRGEKTTPLALPQTLWFVLVCPKRGLSTADVYRQVAIPSRPETGTEMLEALAAGNVVEIGRRLHNRLQPAALALYPGLAPWIDRLAAFGPAGQAMSGSGSSLFALCHDEQQAQAMARQLASASSLPEDGGNGIGKEERMNARVFLVRSCS
jgi:4-diphosphocytidyl-2-C-methyl-D-erythritol kinase